MKSHGARRAAKGRADAVSPPGAAFSAADHAYMARALQLAENGLLTTTPNPRVGCVIVRDSIVLGEGWTQPAGHNHAEIQALQDAAQRGHDVRGATAYVTLEPCSHFGRTPPCADALIRAGLARVVAAMEDPNPQVSGRGLARLRAAGIDTASGLLADPALELNIGFASRMTRGRPWVRLKVAATLDGGTALANGASQWITGAAARADGHRWRARACAVLTGIGTVRADDPQLSVRAIDTPRQPWRVVVDARLETPAHAKILVGGNTLIACTDPGASQAEALRAAGAEVVACGDGGGRIDLAALLTLLGQRGVNELHVEAGATLSGALVTQGLADEIVIYLAPALMGRFSRGLLDLPEFATLGEIPRLRLTDVKTLGEDLRMIGRFAV